MEQSGKAGSTFVRLVSAEILLWGRMRVCYSCAIPSSSCRERPHTRVSASMQHFYSQTGGRVSCIMMFTLEGEDIFLFRKFGLINNLHILPFWVICAVSKRGKATDPRPCLLSRSTLRCSRLRNNFLMLLAVLAWLQWPSFPTGIIKALGDLTQLTDRRGHFKGVI